MDRVNATPVNWTFTIPPVSVTHVRPPPPSRWDRLGTVADWTIRLEKLIDLGERVWRWVQPFLTAQGTGMRVRTASDAHGRSQADVGVGGHHVGSTVVTNTGPLLRPARYLGRSRAVPDAQLTTSRWPPLPMTTARLRARSRSSMLMAKRTRAASGRDAQRGCGRVAS